VSARARLALTTGLIVLLMLVTFEALFYVDVLRSEAPSVESLIAARAPRALVLGACAAGLATLLAAWWGSRVLRGLTSVVSMAADLTDRGDFSSGRSRRRPGDGGACPYVQPSGPAHRAAAQHPAPAGGRHRA
jgi:hypothetical protein